MTIGYIHIAPSLPDEETQRAAIGEVHHVYRDADNKRAERSMMIEDMKLRPDETIRIATAPVLGVGRDLTATLKRIVGASVHVCDIDETIPVTPEARQVLSYTALAERMAKGSRLEGATAKAGRKPVTTPEQDAEILRLHGLGVSLEKIAADTGVKYPTVRRRIVNHEKEASDDG